MEHTSPETQNINNKIVSCVRKKLIEENVITKEDEIDIITSSKLSNKKKGLISIKFVRR